MSTTGRRLLSSLVRLGDVSTYLKLALEPALFKEGETLLYDSIQKHLTKYGTLPKQSTIEKWPGMADSVVDAPEPPKFYMEETERRYLHNSLKAGVQEVASLLTQASPEEALEVFTRITVGLYKNKQRKHVLDFRDAADLVQAQYAAQIADAGSVALPFGWGTLDEMSGGARAGDLISIVGRPMCLSGDTQLEVSRTAGNRHSLYSLKDLFHRFHGLPLSREEQHSQSDHWDAPAPTRINSLGDDSLILLNDINDIVYSGKKITYTVTCANGKSLRSTLEHQFLTPDGYRQLKDIKVGDKVICQALRHVDKKLQKHCKKYSVDPCEVLSIEIYGEEDTYDVCMNYPYNNFVAHDFVVHNSGKTFQMLYAARHGWRTSKRSPALFSMEMSAGLINQRLASMDSQVKLTHLMKSQLSTKAYHAMMDKLHDLKAMAKPFWVVDSNVVKTVDDIIMQCHILQPDCVWIDAAYLLKHSNSRLGKWDRQSENVEMIKEKIATDLEVPVICSYQLSKDSAKSKKKNKDERASMEDIYGSDAIAQISSVILGLFQFEDDVEALNKRRVQILKGRSGETGEFTINWDFSSKMDFSEYKPEKPEDVQMSHLG